MKKGMGSKGKKLNKETGILNSTQSKTRVFEFNWRVLLVNPGRIHHVPQVVSQESKIFLQKPER